MWLHFNFTCNIAIIALNDYAITAVTNSNISQPYPAIVHDPVCHFSWPSALPLINAFHTLLAKNEILKSDLLKPNNKIQVGILN